MAAGMLAATAATGDWCESESVVLPVIDLAVADEAQTAAALTTVASEHGFMLVVGHGVASAANEAAQSLQHRLEMSTHQQLMSWRRNKVGYGPGLQHAKHNSSRKTLEGKYEALQREDFVFVSPDDATRKATGDPHYSREAAAVWYDDVDPLCPDEALCGAFARYYRGAEGLAVRLLRLFARAVTGDADAWAAHARRHKSNLVGAYHRAGVAHQRVSAHSDANLFTLIHYGNGGPDGLEIFDRGCAGWLRVRGAQLRDAHGPDVGAPPLLLNIGDGLAWLSNGRFLSTPHRVTDRSASPPARLALIFFFAASYDAVLEPHVRRGEVDRYGGARLAGRFTYNYRTASAARRDAFDAWAKGAGLPAAEHVSTDKSKLCETVHAS